MSCLPVFEHGSPCGSLTVEREGLYLRFRARVELPENAGLVRLHAVGEGVRADLGILVPEGGARTLSCRLPAARFPEKFTHGELLLPEPGWRAFSGTVCRLRVASGLTRSVDGVTETAFVYAPEQAGRLLPYLAQLRTMEHEGQLWVILRNGNA